MMGSRGSTWSARPGLLILAWLADLIADCDIERRTIGLEPQAELLSNGRENRYDPCVRVRSIVLNAS
jgi:hypothetical protein